MKRKNFIFSAFVLPVFLLSFGMQFLLPTKVFAASVDVQNLTTTAIDAANIRIRFDYNGEAREILLTDADIFDSNKQYEKVGASKDGCYGQLKVGNKRTNAYKDAVNAIANSIRGNFNSVEDGDISVDQSVSFVNGKQAEKVLLVGEHAVSGIDLDFKPTPTGNCVGINGYDGGEDAVEINTPSKLMNFWQRVDGETIKRIDNRNDDYTFKKLAGDANLYTRNKEDGQTCQDFLYVIGNSASLYEMKNGGNTDYLTSIGRNKSPGCENARLNFNTLYFLADGNQEGWFVHNWNPMSVWQTSIATAPAPVPATGGGTGTAPGPAGTTPEKTCETGVGFLGFIMCPVINMIDGGMELIDKLILRMLEVEGDIFDNPAMKNAWSNVRDLAYIITVPIMLVMVIGTALGFEFISAYTVKKSLPRLVLAVIFISLSYQICVFLINLSNSVGQGTLGFLTFPFGSSINDFFKPQENLLSGIFLAFTGGPAAVVGLILLLWLFGGTILLFAAMGFLVLLLREMIIIFLVLLAPLAILAWVFPGNDKLWKTWWGLFSKLLIMYPLIMALIAAGRIFAFVIGAS